MDVHLQLMSTGMSTHLPALRVSKFDLISFSYREIPRLFIATISRFCLFYNVDEDSKLLRCFLKINFCFFFNLLLRVQASYDF